MKGFIEVPYGGLHLSININQIVSVKQNEVTTVIYVAGIDRDKSLYYVVNEPYSTVITKIEIAQK